MTYNADRPTHSKEPDSIIALYLKGMTLRQLALHFNRSEGYIENILLINEIPIVDNALPKKQGRNKQVKGWAGWNRKRRKQ